MNRKILATAILALAAAGAQATEIYAHVGTEGYGIGMGYQLSEKQFVRGEIGGYSIDKDFDAGNYKYKAEAKFEHYSAFYDLHPFDAVNGFRLTGGVVTGKDRVSVELLGGQVNYGSYSAALQKGDLFAEVKMPTVRPYLGVGWGHGAAKGWGFAADIGVTIGKPKFNFYVTPAAQAAAPYDVADAQAKVEDKLDKVKFFPVAKVALTYTF